VPLGQFSPYTKNKEVKFNVGKNLKSFMLTN